MKRTGKRLLLALAMLCTVPAFAQDKIESLSRGGKVRVGGFGAPLSNSQHSTISSAYCWADTQA